MSTSRRAPKPAPEAGARGPRGSPCDRWPAKWALLLLSWQLIELANSQSSGQFTASADTFRKAALRAHIRPFEETTANSTLPQQPQTGVAVPEAAPAALSEPIKGPIEEPMGDSAGDKAPSNGTAESTRRQQEAAQLADEYLVGVGIADITGPAADINLMGYARPNQDSSGIHLRQFSRAIVIEDRAGHRMLYVSLDAGMVSQLLTQRLLARLAASYGRAAFNESNVMISATHSHSCPGGFFQYMLYNIPSAGFINQTLEALLGGVERSVARALQSSKPARLYYSQGELLNASANRSPAAYDMNPAEERQLYQHNTDKTMQLIKVLDSRSGEPLAALSWFPVHGTSMNSSNRLISSDNKGYASILFEQELNANTSDWLPGKQGFVAIFAQANEGDVSPNLAGERCFPSGEACERVHSTCKLASDRCVASGPGADMFESTRIIAERQYAKARQLFLEAREPVRGPVRFIHEYVDMSKQEVPLYKSALELARRRHSGFRLPLNASFSTCQAALGYSFAAGTTDGPGSADFQQGDTASASYWNMLRDFVRRPSKQQVKCHQPKPIFLSTGQMDFPYQWQPSVVSTQLISVGQAVLVALPGEFTTMAGRRVRQAVQRALDTCHAGAEAAPIDRAGDCARQWDQQADDHEQADTACPETAASVPGGNGAAASSQACTQWRRLQMKPRIILSGLSNLYSSYVATLEEYQLQRYEAASTLYGPHTLQAYVNQFAALARKLAAGLPAAPNQVQPPDLSGSLFSLKPAVLYDTAPSPYSFGDPLLDVDTRQPYKCGDLVRAVFVAGNPRNNLRQESTFLQVQKYLSKGNWRTVATDASWDTKFLWERTSSLLGESKAVVEWHIPQNCEPACYRILHLGAHKSLFQTVHQYSGSSSLFQVLRRANASASPPPVEPAHLCPQQPAEELAGKQQKVHSLLSSLFKQFI